MRYAEKKLEGSLPDEINLLYQAMDIASESKDFKDALQAYIDLICDCLHWPVGHAYLLNESDEAELLPSKIWHIKRDEQNQEFIEVTEKTRFQYGVGLPGRVWKSKRAVWIEDVTKDPNFPRAKLCEHIKVRGAIGFPIQSKMSVIAVLEFFSYEATPENPAILDVLQLLSKQVSRVFERRRDADIHHSYPDGNPYPRELCPMYAALTDGEVHHVIDEVLWRKDGTAFPVEYTSTPMRKNEVLVGAVVTFRDIHEQIRAKEKLAYMAKHDYLTSLFNRAHFESIMQEYIDRDKKSKRFDNRYKIKKCLLNISPNLIYRQEK